MGMIRKRASKKKPETEEVQEVPVEVFAAPIAQKMAGIVADAPKVVSTSSGRVKIEKAILAFILSDTRRGSRCGKMYRVDPKALSRYLDEKGVL